MSLVGADLFVAILYETSICLVLKITGLVSMIQQHWPEMARWMDGGGKCESLDIFYCLQLIRERKSTTWKTNANCFLNKNDMTLLLFDTEENISLKRVDTTFQEIT